MAQWVKHLPSKHENMKLDHHSSDMAGNVCNPCAPVESLEVETGESPESCGQANLVCQR